MQKKKISKLEIKREDILNLSIDEAQTVIGGGVYTTDMNNKECSTSYCSHQGCDNETYPCDNTIVDSELCGISSAGNCETGWCGTGWCGSGWCEHTQNDSSYGCART